MTAGYSSNSRNSNWAANFSSELGAQSALLTVWQARGAGYSSRLRASERVDHAAHLLINAYGRCLSKRDSSHMDIA